jgi:4-amino-4-deoxy-L-arabinose transferase-like glycosyltransferase
MDNWNWRMSLAEVTTKGVDSSSRLASEFLKPRSIFTFLAAIFFLNLLLRVFYLRYQFVNGDEGVRALTATGLLDGARLYADIVTDKPPATTFFYAAVFALFGRSMVAVHLVAALWNFFTSLAVFKTASCIYGKRTGLFAALLFVYFSASYFTQDMMAANTELLMALPYSASLYFYLRGLLAKAGDNSVASNPATADERAVEEVEPFDDKLGFNDESKSSRASLHLLIAGLLTGLAVMFKQLGVFNIAFFCLCELFFIYRARRKAPLLALLLQSVRRLLLIAAGVMVVLVTLVLWLQASGTLADFWRYVFVMNTYYIDTLSTDLWLKFMVKRIFGYVGFNLSLWILALWTVWRAGKKFFENRQRKLSSDAVEKRVANTSNVEWIVILWAMVSLAAVFTSGRFFGHYFIQVLPALAILAARSFALLLERIALPAYQQRARVIAVALLVFFIFGLVRIHHRTAVLAYETLAGTRTRFSESWGMSQREHEAEIISQAVRETLNAGESLYIWDYALDIYWRTSCRPASRFITPNHLTGDSTDTGITADLGQGDFWKQNRQLLLTDLQRNRPRMILDPTGGIEQAPYAEIVKFVKENYERDSELGIYPARPFVVYKLKED